MKSYIQLWLFVVLGSVAFAQSVPPMINYQGRLTSETGANLPAGGYVIQFRLWDDPVATNLTELIWAQQQSVTIQANGAFNVLLGAQGGASIPGVVAKVNDISFAFTDPNRFLGLTIVSNRTGLVGAATEILPRQQILSTPFAFQSGNGVPPGTIQAFGGATARLGTYYVMGEQ